MTDRQKKYKDLLLHTVIT